MKTRPYLFAAIIVTAACAAFAADPPRPEQPVFTDPEQAGRDFQFQGEYAAENLGIQVIALGDNRFRAVFHNGGLPGAGYDGTEKTEIHRAGAASSTIQFTGVHTATLINGKITGKTGQGIPFEAKKVIRKSPTLGAKPPAGAKVLFDGTNADAWNGRMNDQSLLLMGSTTKDSFQDFSLHLEFILPFKPHATGQARGNSGVYIQNRYEVQILDSFGLKGEDNECGGLYRTAAPSVNMCFPPLSWQTYDIDFTAARFDPDGKKIANALVTVRHNGVTIHDQQQIPAPTGGGKAESSEPGPINLQNHGNPVFFRNIWIVPKEPSDAKLSIFNGKDLSGWHGNTDIWGVENGEIVGRHNGFDKNDFLKSDFSVDDFRLILQAKLINDSGNSGIQFRSQPWQGHEMKGYQADIGPGWWGKLYEESARGLLVQEGGEQFVRKGDWNTYEIVAVGHRILMAINGRKVVDFEDPKGDLKGIFGLQVHSGPPTEVRFRNLQLQLNPRPELITTASGQDAPPSP